MNGLDGKAPLMLDTIVGTPVVLDASKSSDRDKNTLQYSWFFYPESESGLPSAGGGRLAAALARPAEGQCLPGAHQMPVAQRGSIGA